MSLMATNYKGVTKKMTVTAVIFLGYCAGNMYADSTFLPSYVHWWILTPSAGPQFFKTSEAPTYPTAFRAIMICYALVVVGALGLRFYLSWMNRKRQMKLENEGVPAFENEDTTDWQSYDMVYRLWRVDDSRFTIFSRFSPFPTLEYLKCSSMGHFSLRVIRKA